MKIALVLGMVGLLSACMGPPPSHALTVRHPELKCALIAFSGCGAFAPVEESDTAEPDAAEPDAQTDEDAGVE